MLLRAPHLSLVLLLGFGFSSVQADENRFAANAGTGPYLIDVQAGLTQVEYGQNFGIRYQVASHLDSIRLALQDWKQNKNDQLLSARIVRNFQDILALDGSLTTLQAQLLGILTKPAAPKTIQPDNVNLAIKFLSDFLAKVCDPMYQLIRADLHDASAHMTRGFRIGTLLGPHQSYEFNTVNISPGEHGLPGQRNAPFLTASEVLPTSGSGSRQATRISGGFGLGDPDLAVIVLSAARYISPAATDLEASLNFKIAPEFVKRGAKIETDQQLKQAASARRLLDHVRPGDVWLSGTYRSISNSASGGLPNGFMIEGALTYALSEKEARTSKYPVPATYLCLSGIYCPQKALGVDEWGIEIRTPLSKPEDYERPIYLSARYGTRGHLTFAIETRF